MAEATWRGCGAMGWGPSTCQRPGGGCSSSCSGGVRNPDDGDAVCAWGRSGIVSTVRVVLVQVGWKGVSVALARRCASSSTRRRWSASTIALSSGLRCVSSSEIHTGRVGMRSCVGVGVAAFFGTGVGGVGGVVDIEEDDVEIVDQGEPGGSCAMMLGQRCRRAGGSALCYVAALMSQLHGGTKSHEARK